jgi:hypothetical protein
MVSNSDCFEEGLFNSLTHKYIVTTRHTEPYQTTAWLLGDAANLSIKDTADVLIKRYPSINVIHIYC